jgi:hypothetical protein
MQCDVAVSHGPWLGLIGPSISTNGKRFVSSDLRVGWVASSVFCEFTEPERPAVLRTTCRRAHPYILGRCAKPRDPRFATSTWIGADQTQVVIPLPRAKAESYSSLRPQEVHAGRPLHSGDSSESKANKRHGKQLDFQESFSTAQYSLHCRRFVVVRGVDRSIGITCQAWSGNAHRPWDWDAFWLRRFWMLGERGKFRADF